MREKKTIRRKSVVGTGVHVDGKVVGPIGTMTEECCPDGF